jgi:hypothetical protein
MPNELITKFSVHGKLKSTLFHVEFTKELQFNPTLKGLFSAGVDVILMIFLIIYLMKESAI